MTDPRPPHDTTPGHSAPPVAGPYAQGTYAQGPFVAGQQPYPAQAPTSAGLPQQGPQYPPPVGPDIRSYAAPRARTSAIVAGVAALVLIGFVVAGIFWRVPRAAPTPTPSASNATTSAPGMPFTMPSDPDSTGRWEIVDREWTPTGVSVHVRVYANTGTVTYGFQAYGKGAADATRPTRGQRTPELTTGSLGAGEVADGYVFLELPHAESTLFLTTRGGRAISALPIRA